MTRKRKISDCIDDSGIEIGGPSSRPLENAKIENSRLPSSTSVLNKVPILKVYVDGSCIHHLTSPKAGYGIYVPALHMETSGFEFGKDVNLWGRLPGIQQTSVRAEICAVIRAIQFCKKLDKRLQIFTDYIQSVEEVERYSIWKSNSEDIFTFPKSNSDLWKRLFDEIDTLKHFPIISYTRGHSGNKNHNQADRNARKGALLEASNSQIFYRQMSKQPQIEKLLFSPAEHL